VAKKDPSLRDFLYDATIQVLFKTERLISRKFYKHDDFARFSVIPTPFMENALRDGIILG
jgi:hypothetical protein